MVRARRYLLGVTLAAAIAVSPASALAGTIANGNYTAAPGEQNRLSVAYDPGTDSYTYSDYGYAITDGDGAGGCSLGPGIGQATCLAVIVSHVNISLGDGDDSASLTGGSAGVGSPLPGPTQVTVGTTIDAGDGSDRIDGGGGNDLISGGPGNDNLQGEGGDDKILGGEGNDTLNGDGGCIELHGLCSNLPPPTAGVDHLDGGPGYDFLGGIEGKVLDGPRIVGFDPTLQRPDPIICGTGGDEGPPPGTALPGSLVDVAQPGTGDEVAADCEAVSQFVLCPAGGTPCQGEVVIEAKAAANASAVASAKKGKKRKLVVGRGHFDSPAGASTLVAVELKRKNLGRVLRGRQKASAQAVIRLNTGKKKGRKSGAATEAKKKSRVLSRTRFVFTKG